MDRWTRFVDWCQQPSKIKIRAYNPRNVVVLVATSIIFFATITFGYQVAVVSPQLTVIPPGDIETLIIATDTTLTMDYVGQIVIVADDITLDGDGHMIIGPGRCVAIGDPTMDPNEQETNRTIGILLEGRTGVTVKDCIVTGFGFGFLLDGSDGNTLHGNTANNNTYGFKLSGSDGNNLEANTANNRMVGFDLWESHWNNLEANMANNNAFGFMIMESQWNNLEANTANNNEFGFAPTYSADNTFRDNTANGNGNGFELLEAVRNTLHGNTANDNVNGFVLRGADGNSFEANTANNNTHAGFHLGGSSNNTFTGNTAANNEYGICYGPADEGIACSPDNRIYHNNFLKNQGQVNIQNSVNAWDDGYPSGGNYWSDYAGVDVDGDGIGDTPYVINQNNMDWFPLMAPTSVFDDGT